MSLLFSHHVTTKVIINAINIIIINPIGLCSNGNSTFIPQKLEIIVGIAKTIVIDVKNFITPFKLLDIIYVANLYH